jgi:hypothetical protein
MNKDIIINNNAVRFIPTKNGIPNEMNLKFCKETFFYDSLRNHYDLVGISQSYPVDERSEITMTLDVVIISKARYDRLIELEKVNEYTYEQFKEIKVNE